MIVETKYTWEEFDIKEGVRVKGQVFEFIIVRLVLSNSYQLMTDDYILDDQIFETNTEMADYLNRIEFKPV
jgi:5-methylcytosine-specific restriction endonuclease McrBC GTP-binding regulatory subunit McrB